MWRSTAIIFAIAFVGILTYSLKLEKRVGELRETVAVSDTVFVDSPPDTIEITAQERKLLNYAKSQTSDPSVLQCVQILASSGFVDWFGWTPPLNCDNTGDLLIDHYVLEYICRVPSNQVTLFVQEGYEQSFRVYPVTATGKFGCAPGDTSWSERTFID